MLYFDTDIINLIQDFAGITQYWKNRFTCDVLPGINKGYKLVAIDRGIPCGWCYVVSMTEKKTFGYCDHCKITNNQFISINFKEFSNLEITKDIMYWRLFTKSGYEITIKAFSWNENSFKIDVGFELKRKIKMIL